MQTATTNPIDTAHFRQHPADTGSVEFQVALLTEKIKRLTQHLIVHKKDKHCRGLYNAIAARKKFLKYLERKSVERYRALILALGLRR
jgi:small subunit ribosomal protein S15